MTPLTRLLLRRIKTDGPISLADYMNECLLHPKYGYYTTRDPFGTSGDFITAPEISQMFGELIGLSLAQSWIDQGKPSPFALTEIGPGRGALMADILRATAKVPDFHASLHLHLVEASPALQSAQREKLSSFNPKWHRNIATLPDMPLFLVANEFFDALPIRQFIRHKEQWSEKHIGVADGALAFGQTKPAPNPGLNHRLKDTNEGDIVEICPSAISIANTIAARIAAKGGAAIIIDYGDWQSNGDTFQAVSKHAFSDPLENPGEDDLTAHVDFSALTQNIACEHTQMTFQGDFLQRLGIAQRSEILAKTLTGDSRTNHLEAYHRLTHTDKMGTLFKVIGLYPKGSPPPAGLAP